jgi:hypothetical protein
MKFVCIECDEPMQLEQHKGIDADGSLSVSFRCPSCEWGVMLLINPQETQMVRSLGVKIGGRTVPLQPMEMVQSHLVRPSEEATSESSGSGCPFSAMLQGAFPETHTGLRWSPEAEQRLERIPSFVRSMVRKGIEELAREKGYGEVTPQVMDEARERMGV